MKRGAVEEATAVLRRAADALAASRLAELLSGRSDVWEAIMRLKVAHHRDDERAATQQARWLLGRSDLQEAMALLRRAAGTGDGNAAERLAVLLDDLGDVEGFLLAKKRPPYCRSRILAELLSRQRDVEGLREQADAGDEKGH